MSVRPNDWKQVINAESETCYWLEPNGTRHPGTEEENLEVRRQLLNMRTVADKHLRDKSEGR